MDMTTQCSDLCPFCGRGGHVGMGPSRIFPTSLSNLLFTALGVPPLRWDSDAGETYSHPTALLSLGSLSEFLDSSRVE